jgi:hypothetical protein
VSWAAPASGGAPSAYVVSYRVTGSTDWATMSASDTSAVIAGLPAGTPYDIKVAAVNLAGTGPVSSVINATTGAALAYAPNVPTGVTVGAVTSSSAAISWAAPAADGTHGAATSYTVQWRQTGTSAWTQQSGVSATGYSITGLIAGTEHDIQVQAVNGAGASAFTATVTATTAPPAGNYALGSGFQPFASGTSYAASATALTNVSDLTTSDDGSHTAPANIYFGWSASSTDAPASTAGMTAADGQFVNGGHNYWYAWAVPAPATPGTYYFWALATDAGGNIVASCVQRDQPIAGGNIVAFTIT